jgi:2-C-methyl-D-erythritol 4-phosphate cytidylyltransferase
MAKFSVILPAAGKSDRFKDREKKPFANLEGRAVWLRSAELFITRSDVVQALIVVAPEDQEVFRRRYAANLAFMNVQIVDGGKERFDSVANALAKVKDEAEYVAIHDAVRPCLTKELIDEVFSEATKTGAATLAVPITDTIKRATPQRVVETTLAREGLWLAQTPQVFRKDWLLQAYLQREKLGKFVTDDGQLLEAAGQVVHLVLGSTTNIKITTKEDLMLAEAILKARPKPKGSAPMHPFADEAQW